jgi:hypothetical protein
MFCFFFFFVVVLSETPLLTRQDKKKYEYNGAVGEAFAIAPLLDQIEEEVAYIEILIRRIVQLEQELSRVTP